MAAVPKFSCCCCQGGGLGPHWGWSPVPHGCCCGVEGGGGGLGGGEVDNGSAESDFSINDPLFNGGEISHGIGFSKGVKAGFIVWGEVKKEAVDLEGFGEAGLAGFEAISYLSHASDIVNRSVTDDRGTEFPSLEAAHEGVRESTKENGAGAGVSSCPGDKFWGEGSHVVFVFGDNGEVSIAASNRLVIGVNCCIVLGFADKWSRRRAARAAAAGEAAAALARRRCRGRGGEWRGRQRLARRRLHWHGGGVEAAEGSSAGGSGWRGRGCAGAEAASRPRSGAGGGGWLGRGEAGAEAASGPRRGAARAAAAGEAAARQARRRRRGRGGERRGRQAAGEAATALARRRRRGRGVARAAAAGEAAARRAPRRRRGRGGERRGRQAAGKAAAALARRRRRGRGGERRGRWRLARPRLLWRGGGVEAAKWRGRRRLARPRRGGRGGGVGAAERSGAGGSGWRGRGEAGAEAATRPRKGAARAAAAREAAELWRERALKGGEGGRIAARKRKKNEGGGRGLRRPGGPLKRIEAYPKATAVLVRNHGVYIWGDNWIQAKTQAECYHYLFDAAIRMHQMGINPCDPLHLPAAAAAAAPAALAATSGGKTFPRAVPPPPHLLPNSHTFPSALRSPHPPPPRIPHLPASPTSPLPPFCREVHSAGHRGHHHSHLLPQPTPTHALLSSPSHLPPTRQKFIVLDIEGTTTPISFVSQVLFPPPPGALPPTTRCSSPTTRCSSPTTRCSSPHHQVLFPHHQVLFPHHQVLFPHHQVLFPPPPGALPPTTRCSSPHHQVLFPPPPGALPPTTRCSSPHHQVLFPPPPGALPPTTRCSSPTTRCSSPHHQVLFPHHQVLFPPPPGALPPPPGALPPPPGALTPTTRCSSPHHQVLFPHHQVLFPHHQVLLPPPPGALPPTTRCSSPHHQVLFPHHQVLFPHHQVLFPHHQVLFPPPPGALPPPPGALPPPPGALPLHQGHVGQHQRDMFVSPEAQAHMLLLRAQIDPHLSLTHPLPFPPPTVPGGGGGVLFPYAKAHVGQHLLDTFNTPETQADMLLLHAQIDEDVKSSVPGAEPVPPLEAGKEAVVGAVERNVAVLFPYAKSHVGQHLLDTFDTPETQADMLLLRAQIEEDIKSSVPGAEPVPPLEAGKEAVVGAVERNVAAMIAADRKVTALKQLQGHIWRGGYEKGELKGEFFSDVLTALTQWQAAGCKAAVERNVAAMIAADRKVTALKQLQGHIWRGGYGKGELKGEFFSDMFTALTQWHGASFSDLHLFEWQQGGAAPHLLLRRLKSPLPPSLPPQHHPPPLLFPTPYQIYIYSSGSREAQHLIFGYSNRLRPPSKQVGDNRQADGQGWVCSYLEIELSLGADSPSHNTFFTDVLEEAQAAKQAGLQAVLLSRPGNGALPADPGFPVLTSLTDL
ncbi:unnamed protein product [Closterium sp. NIES-65]|nr:unnamed protein product [Closterium sp. NIES-65]